MGTSALRYLGVDPGSRHTGWGIIEARSPQELCLVECGVISTGEAEFSQRLTIIFDGLSAVVESYEPQDAAVESLFHARNAQSALKLGHARGVALLALAKSGLSIAEYAPKEVKKAVTGSGNADKDQVARMVEMLLGRTGAMRKDATDALAVAVCHAVISATRQRLEGGRPRV